MHFHVYASPDYIKRFGEPKTLEDLDQHRIISFGGDQPSYLLEMHWLTTVGRDRASRAPRHFEVNNIAALKPAVETGAGIAVLPDYAVDGDSELVQVLRDAEMPHARQLSRLCRGDARTSRASRRSATSWSARPSAGPCSAHGRTSSAGTEVTRHAPVASLVCAVLHCRTG